MIKVPLASLLHGPHSKGYEMDNDTLAALTDAYLKQEVEIWPKKQQSKKKLKSIMESPEAAELSTPKPRKRQISDTSTPSPKKQKQKPAKFSIKPLIVNKKETEQEPEPDVLTWTFTAEGLKPMNHNNSFAVFNARMAERQKQIEEQEREDEFHYWAGKDSFPDIGSLYDCDSSDSILSSSQPDQTSIVVAADDMQCHEILDLTIPELIL
jgi:hypothetical protein